MKITTFIKNFKFIEIMWWAAILIFATTAAIGVLTDASQAVVKWSATITLVMFTVAALLTDDRKKTPLVNRYSEQPKTAYNKPVLVANDSKRITARRGDKDKATHKGPPLASKGFTRISQKRSTPEKRARRN